LLHHLTPPSFKLFISPQSRKGKRKRNQKTLDEMIEAIYKKTLKQMDSAHKQSNRIDIGNEEHKVVR
jgi:hypothetical protein